VSGIEILNCDNPNVIGGAATYALFRKEVSGLSTGDTFVVCDAGVGRGKGGPSI